MVVYTSTALQKLSLQELDTVGLFDQYIVIIVHLKPLTRLALTSMI